MPTCLGLHMLAERQAMHKTFEIPLDIPDVMIEKVGTDRHGDFVMTVKSTIEGTHCHICGKKITQVYGDDREITVRHLSILGRKTFGSLVLPGIHNSIIFMANKECPYKSSWIL